MRRATLGIVVAALLTLGTGASAAQFAVGSGASVDLGTGSLDLGCVDLDVSGTLSAGTNGFTQTRDLSIGSTGVLNGDSGTGSNYLKGNGFNPRVQGSSP